MIHNLLKEEEAELLYNYLCNKFKEHSIKRLIDTEDAKKKLIIDILVAVSEATNSYGSMKNAISHAYATIKTHRTKKKKSEHWGIETILLELLIELENDDEELEEDDNIVVVEPDTESNNVKDKVDGGAEFVTEDDDITDADVPSENEIDNVHTDVYEDKKISNTNNNNNNNNNDNNDNGDGDDNNNNDDDDGDDNNKRKKKYEPNHQKKKKKHK